MKPLCRNKNAELCEKDRKYTICEKVRTFALKNFQMIQTRNMSKAHEQISRIVAKRIAIGPNFGMFDKEEQRLFEKSSVEILSSLKPEFSPMRNESETVESVLQEIQENLLTGEG